MTQTSPLTQSPHRRRRWKIRSVGQWFMGGVILIYSSVLIRLLVKRHQKSIDANSMNRDTSRTPSSIRSGVVQSQWKARIALEQVELERWFQDESIKMQATTNERRKERQQLVNPPPVSTWNNLKRQPNKPPRPFIKNLPVPDDSQNLCNLHGSQRALNSTSRVLITGIASSPLATHLALYLSTYCHVSTMVGVDALLPNTSMHRMKLFSNRLNMLSRVIPKLTLDVPFVGMEAPSKKTSANWMERHSPTHVVHLQPIHAERIYTRTTAGGPDEAPRVDVFPTPLPPLSFKNQDPTWWSVYGANRPVHVLKQMRLAMDQLFGTIVNAHANHLERYQEMMRNVHASNQLQNDLGRMGGHYAAGAAKSADETQVKAMNIPHIVYASVLDVPPTSAMDHIARTVALTNEWIAASYANGTRLAIPSLGLRLGTVYGPHDHFMAPAYQMAERFLEDPSTMIGDHEASEDFSAMRDWLYVDDAVRAVVMAMQMDLQGKHSIVDVSSKSPRRSIRYLTDIAKDIALNLDLGAELKISKMDGITPNELGWKATTPLEIGLQKLFAWHYEQAYAFPPISSTAEPSRSEARHRQGQQLLYSEAGIANCAYNDTFCLRGSIIPLIPCSSECSASKMCTQSIWDSVKDVLKQSSQDCQTVLYTIALGRDVTMMPHRLSPQDLRFDGHNVCNLAIVPQESELALNIIRRIPNEDGTAPTSLTDEQIAYRFKEYNGLVEADGWTAVWVPPYVKHQGGNSTLVSLLDASLINSEIMMLKMTPGGFFDSSVKFAMYVDETFNVSPTQDDVEFLVSEVERSARQGRMVKYYPTPEETDESGTVIDPPKKPRAIKFLLPPEPSKRAILLLSPIRKPKETKKLNTNAATKLMLHELGLSTDASVPLKRQRAYYETVASKVNKDSMRSMYEQQHRYSQAPFYTRSKWLIHDLTLEEARQMRCEWYHEHLSWNNELDALSISAVLARRDIERKFKWNEVDQREKLKIFQIPEGLTDEADWSKVYRENVKPKKSNLYVRIMTDEEMLSSRKAWVKQKQ